MFQSMLRPYGAPYAAFYANGGIYARPGVPLVSFTFLGLQYATKYDPDICEGAVFDHLVWKEPLSRQLCGLNAIAIIK